MRLTIIAPDNVYEHEVDPSMEVQDVQALVEAETGLPAASFHVSNDSGVALTESSRSLESYGMKGEMATVFLTIKDQPHASSSTACTSSSGGHSLFPTSNADFERMRLQALGNPSLMAQLRQNDPSLASAIQEGGPRFREEFMRYQDRLRNMSSEKERQIEALNSDPYDIEAQKKIEEAIRMEAVQANMDHAMEFSPEAFGNVHMLYINVEVNGHPVKAFVDSGAQTTIISPECAEACGIMRLLDTRFAGMAMGVGTARILGRVHSAQIKLGSLYLPCSFSVLEGRSVDLLFGLDMLKRHQCCIDLSTNTLRINNTEVPFLAEHELPEKARVTGEAQVADEMGSAAGAGVHAGVAPPKSKARDFPGAGNALGGPSAGATRPGGTTLAGGPGGSVAAGAAVGSGGSQPNEVDVQTLIGLGAPRDQAIQLLEASGGNVDVAASMLFG